ncbi:AsmA family protein [Martelella limonii]|uniref:AsmA family protein n=1 Tax=Martelella limonii TaxID=1647649 RepID=UPI001580D6E1|nr:AsmA-like C-terminal region-containing protein [Martelella limonii]
MKNPFTTGRTSGRTPRLRRSPLVRYGLAGGILLAVGAYHLVPSVISPGAMSSAFEEELSGWLGAPASITGQADISYWPRPRLITHGAAVPRPGGGGLLVYGNAGTLTADISLYGALTGHPSFSNLALDNAVLIFEDAEGATAANPMAKAIASARDGHVDVLNGKGPGALTLANSTIAIAGEEEPWIIKAVNGDFEWARLDGAAEFSGSAEFAGEPTTVSVWAAKPAAVLAGQSSKVELSITNSANTVSYQGTASGREPYFLDGTFSLSTSDLQKLLAALGVETRLLGSVERASLKGQVSRSGNALRFSPIDLAFGDAKGSGVLDIVPQAEDGPSRVTATMAFSDIALFDAESSLPGWIDTMMDRSDDDERYALSDLDLRISAGTVRLSDITLSDVAASVIRTDEQTSFDIADSKLDTGSLFAHISVRNDDSADVRLNAEAVKSAPLFRQLGVAVPLESDALSLELNYAAALPFARDGKDGLTGSFRFSAQAGTLNWLDLASILETARNSRSFAFSPLKQSPYAFRAIKGRGTLNGAELTLDGVTIEAENEEITINGRIDTDTGKLSAHLTAVPTSGDGAPIALDIDGNALAAFARVSEATPPAADE